MRQVVLDTETTGLEPADGHRIIEIGAVEIINRRRTGRTYHQYLWPERDIDQGALNIHGITMERLRNCPLFKDVVTELLAFVRGAEVVIHNAPFDIGFLDHEMHRADAALGRFLDYCSIADSLQLARELHPGQRNSLDALCARYEVDNSARDLHGALLDAEILADVYLAMTGGQASLVLTAVEAQGPGVAADGVRVPRRTPIIEPSAAELAAHRARLAAIEEASGKCIWMRLESTVAPLVDA